MPLRHRQRQQLASTKKSRYFEIPIYRYARPVGRVFWFTITRPFVWLGARGTAWLAVFMIAAIAALILVLNATLPDPSTLTHRYIAQSTKIYDRTGKILLYEIHGSERRTTVPLETIPNNIKWATIVAEDNNFYNHQGFDLTGIARSIIVDILHGGKSQGGSTITQQFIKNALLGKQKTFSRKIKELLLAYNIEHRFTKDQILKMYLNEIPYGRLAYGVQAASFTYFGKSVDQLTLAQAAALAALPKAPSYYSPYGSHKDELIGRQQFIIHSMARLGYITRAEETQAINEPLAFVPPREQIIAPHFVMYVKELLEQRFDPQEVEEGGLTVTTTLDAATQAAAEAAVEKHASDNETRHGATNAALVALDPATGQIRAMVGSRNYFDTAHDGNVNVALRPRQPGSSLKPFIYAAAFEKGFTPETILYDVVTTFKAYPKDYEPHNYGDKTFGPIPMKKALAGSLNIPAVKTLYLVGIDRALQLFQNLGYTTFNDRSRFGLSIVLGGGEVKLLEHVAAYGALSQEGVYHAPQAIISVRDAQGTEMPIDVQPARQILPTNIARTITSILSTNDLRSFIFGAKNSLILPDRPVAAKTGTTNDFHDAWTLGYTPSLVAGVWVGNNDNKPMKGKADGSIVAAPIWRDFMMAALAKTPPQTFTPPTPLVSPKPLLNGVNTSMKTIVIDTASGKLATARTPERFRKELQVANYTTILHDVNKDDPAGPAPVDPTIDPQYQPWQDAIDRWAKEHGDNGISIPTTSDDVHVPENEPSIAVSTPLAGTIVSNQLPLTLDASAKHGVVKVECWIGNRLIQTELQSPFPRPYSTILTIPGDITGSQTLTIKAYDDVDNVKEISIPITIQ